MTDLVCIIPGKENKACVCALPAWSSVCAAAGWCRACWPRTPSSARHCSGGGASRPSAGWPRLNGSSGESLSDTQRAAAAAAARPRSGTPNTHTDTQTCTHSAQVPKGPQHAVRLSHDVSLSLALLVVNDSFRKCETMQWTSSIFTGRTFKGQKLKFHRFSTYGGIV